MHDAPRVRVRQRVGQLLAVREDLVERQRAMGQPLAQRLPLDQFHGDVRLVVGLADVVHRADVGMIELGGQARFTHEPRPGGLIGHRLGGQYFQRDLPLEPRIARAVDLPHPARPQGGHDLIRPEMRPGCEGHRSRWGLRSG